MKTNNTPDYQNIAFKHAFLNKYDNKFPQFAEDFETFIFRTSQELYAENLRKVLYNNNQINNNNIDTENS